MVVQDCQVHACNLEIGLDLPERQCQHRLGKFNFVLMRSRSPAKVDVDGIFVVTLLQYFAIASCCILPFVLECNFR